MVENWSLELLSFQISSTITSQEVFLFFCYFWLILKFACFPFVELSHFLIDKTRFYNSNPVDRDTALFRIKLYDGYSVGTSVVSFRNSVRPSDHNLQMELRTACLWRGILKNQLGSSSHFLHAPSFHLDFQLLSWWHWIRAWFRFLLFIGAMILHGTTSPTSLLFSSTSIINLVINYYLGWGGDPTSMKAFNFDNSTQIWVEVSKWVQLADSSQKVTSHRIWMQDCKKNIYFLENRWIMGEGVGMISQSCDPPASLGVNPSKCPLPRRRGLIWTLNPHICVYSW